jgi:hypothetical protein
MGDLPHCAWGNYYLGFGWLLDFLSFEKKKKEPG